MKKFYFLLLLSLTFGNIDAQPACTYDYTWLALGKNGVWPDSATNFVNGTVGQPYLQNVTIKVPYDTVSGSTTFHFDHVDLQTNITNPLNYGLPAGLSLAGTPSNLKFPGNDTSCMVIYGTPTTAGTYILKFVLKTWVVEFPFAPVSTDTLNYYKIVIAPAAGVASYSANNVFSVYQNTPNPVKDNATIKFLAPTDGKARLSVYNIAGQKIYEKETSALRGENTFDYDASQLENGVYLYTVEMNQLKQSRRMVVAR